MSNKNNILCIIPARSGSKGIINKNIYNYNEQPLLSWSINQAKESKYNLKIFVSTDSEIYQKIAIEYGAECPVLRPSDISQDLSIDYDFILHTLEWLKDNENYLPSLIVQLRPTYPNRKIKVIDECIELFLNNIDKYDSLRSVIPIDKSPYKMYNIKEDVLVPLFTEVNDIKEPYNQPRQILPKCFLHNGYIDIIKTETIYKYKDVTGNTIYPYVMNPSECDDIDTIEDLINSKKKNIINYNIINGL
jgi:CMP-N,N'-diacetyllegionaminic acid synthase